MGTIVAVGVPVRFTSGIFDWTPLIAAVALLLSVRYLMGWRLSPALGALALLCGLLFSDAANRWGLAPATALALLLATTLSAVVSHGRAR